MSLVQLMRRVNTEGGAEAGAAAGAAAGANSGNKQACEDFVRDAITDSSATQSIELLASILAEKLFIVGCCAREDVEGILLGVFDPPLGFNSFLPLLLSTGMAPSAAGLMRLHMVDVATDYYNPE